MPIYVYSCDNDHVVEKYKSIPNKQERRFRCKECGLYMRRDYKLEHKDKRNEIIGETTESPISHLFNRRSFQGITIEALTPEPVRVTSKRQYDKLLKDTHSLEKITRYGG